MTSLSDGLGADVRPALCSAFDAATRTIDAEFYSISDPAVVASLNRAAARGVRVRVVVEGDPHRYRRGTPREPDAETARGGLCRDIDVIVSHLPRALVHGKAAVVDDCKAVILTANPVPSGLDDPGDVIVVDRCLGDVAQIEAKIRAAWRGQDLGHALRARLDDMLRSRADLRIASEDLSDWGVVRALVSRARSGAHDRVIVNGHPSS